MKKVIYLQQVSDELGKVSPTLCLAKWTQTTLHLNTGHTHSCHHPKTHKIDLSNIEENPLSLHNTKRKMQARNDMLKGIQTPECDYCWTIENLEVEHYSDRHFKSATDWSYPHFKDVINSGLGETYFPSYVEVNFDSTCNFRCLYCSADVSSRWMEDSLKGPYKLPHQNYNDLNWLKSEDKIPFTSKEHNPYVDAFWKAWLIFKEKLDHFRITGGEPLLSKNTWNILDDLIDNPQPKLNLSINTNMCVPSNLIDKFIEKLNKVKPNVKTLTVFTSIEGNGQEQEYVRDGMDTKVFWRNVDKLLALSDASVTYMTTINAFSAQTLPEFIDIALEQRSKYKNRINISFNYLRHPNFLALPVLSRKARQVTFNKWQAKIEASPSLYSNEKESLTRIISWALSQPDVESSKEDLRAFIDQVETRRGLSKSRAQWVLDNL